VAIAAAGVLLAGCSNTTVDRPESAAPSATTATPNATPSVEPVVCPHIPIEVAIDYTLVKEADGGVHVTARSNLPDGSELMASFYADGGAYFAQETKPLQAGVAALGPFSDKGTPLHGSYEFSITLSKARNQPQQVQDCIGPASENLTGPLVSRDEISGDKYASLDKTVTID
jgi:hypothetical protein